MLEPVESAHYVEIWTHAGTAVRTLDGDLVTVGKDPANDIDFPSDPTMSQTHAVFQRYPAGWSVRDLGALNGTYVNGRRIWQEQRLRHRDRVQVGAAQLTYCYAGDVAGGGTERSAVEALPELTRRELDVLLQLCLPALEAVQGKTFVRPADDRRIGEVLVIGEGGVRQRLAALYDKFGIEPGDEHEEPRRVRLANEAMRRGSVTLDQLATAAREREAGR